MRFEIGIINAETGRQIQRRLADSDDALKVAQEVSQWFDERDTFFSGKPIWGNWELTGIGIRLRRFVDGRSLISDVVSQSVIVFTPKKRLGVEHEFYIKRLGR